ncbi:MAG: LysR family transcriptional regulator [Pseudomonadota bacterium]
MNWDAVSFDWNQVRAFLATVEEGSFTGAARVLKSTQPTIGRQVAELEATLSVTLFERSVRGPTLTEAGTELLNHVRAMGEAATLISVVADGKSQEVSGDVTVTATDLMSAVTLPPILEPLRTTAPGIRIRIVAASDIRNLVQREADIAIRHVRPEQPELIGRHIGDFRANLYAASIYLDRAGRPQGPQDMAHHSFVGPFDQDRLIATLQNLGLPFRAESFVVASDSGMVVWELMKAGFGMSFLPEVLCDAEPSLEKVLPDLPPIQFPIWLVTHRELQTSRKIRIVFDQLARGLSDAIRVSAVGKDA